ncbi:S8/S53 family peptidase [Palleronia pelagia]|uniref:Subtilase family protein n=1 Tax=Palleronia pelagia TaxID=387096 RepID=A0A1H8DLF3_9RHOB|nr:S8/S53 family peptidase [Palleronia pelagia]SEN08099.1 Subtilase family protein [Palleronia pelagia]
MDGYTETAVPAALHYDALWHLVTLGVLDADHAPRGWALSKPEKPTKVVVIDTSAAPDHPNLVDAIDRDLSLDFFSARLGSFPYLPEGQDQIGALPLDWTTTIADGLPRSSGLLAELVDRLSSGSAAHHLGVQPCVSPMFSAHGTNIAGLVGARPAIAQQALPGGGTADLPLPYSGVDPMCRIIQVSTNFDPAPESLILAFLYADLVGADVVLLPRVIADPVRTVPELDDIKIGDRSLGDMVRQVAPVEGEADLWSELAALIVAVSHRRPVVCAAGNAAEDGGIYPANLATDHNGIISVGAVNAKGQRSGFAPARGVTVAAPSNDAEIFDATEIRLDESAPDYDPIGVPVDNDNAKYSRFDVISTDVPGPAGYSGSSVPTDPVGAPIREFGSYFSRFGGTSAASALVAGFLSLGMSTGAMTGRSGVEAKGWLLGKCHAVGDPDAPLSMPCWDGKPTFPDA